MSSAENGSKRRRCSRDSEDYQPGPSQRTTDWQPTQADEDCEIRIDEECRQSLENDRHLDRSPGEDSPPTQYGMEREFPIVQPSQISLFANLTRAEHTTRVTIDGDQLVSRLSQTDWGRQTRLVREAVSVRNPQRPYADINYVARRLQDKGCKFWCITQHGNHWHIVHTCTWLWYQCKCFSRSQFVGHNRILRTTRLDTVSEYDWTHLILYLCSDGRCIQYLYCSDGFYRDLNGLEFIPYPQVSDASSQGTLARSLRADEGMPPDSPGVSGSQVDYGQGGGQGKNQSLVTSNPRAQEVESFILQHLVVPLESITETTVWHGSKFKFINTDNRIIRNVLHSLRSRMCHWDTEYFYIHYRETSPLWNAKNGNIHAYYMTIDETVSVMRTLLEHQLIDYAMAEGQSINQFLKQFLDDLYKLLERNLHKRNTLELIGPSNAGKSFFAEWVLDYYINRGNIRNFSKYESFPLMDAWCRRVNLWNEANPEPASYDTVKLILGGDPCNAAIKYEGDKCINKTPVIITANQRCIPRNEPFNERMIRYDWKRAPFLGAYTKKPHPLAWPVLLNDYDVIDWFSIWTYNT